MKPGAKFCSECGQPTGSSDSELTPIRLDGRLGATRTVSEGQVTRDGSLRLIAATAVAFIAVVVLLLVVSRSGSDDETADQDGGEELPSSPDGPSEAEGNDDGGAGAAASASVELSDSAEGADLATTLAGYQLIAVGRGRLLTVDIDNDRVDDVGVAGDPVGVVDNELILFRPAEGFVAVDLSDPLATPRVVIALEELAEEEAEAAVERPVTATIRSNGTLLIEYSVSPLGSIEAKSIVYEVSVESGDFERSILNVGQATWWFGHGGLGLAWVPGAGLFDGLGGPTRKVSEGFPIVFGADFVVTYQCSEPAQCGVEWIDRHSDQQLDHTLPPIEDLWWNSIEIGVGGQLLLAEGSNEARYFDVKQGQWLPKQVNEAQEGVAKSRRFGHRPEAVSDDGRWLAIPDGPRLTLYDLENDDLFDFNVIGLTGGQRLFFVE